MSYMTDFPENLLVRARRAALLPGERSEFERVLATSPTLRTAYRLGRDFDEIAAVEPGDEQRVERFVDRALAARRPRRSPFVRVGWLSPWLAAAAVLAVCGVAFGFRAVWWPQYSSNAVSPPAQSATAPARRKLRASPTPRAVSPPLSEPSAATTPADQSATVNRGVIESTARPPSSTGHGVTLPATAASAIRVAPPVAPMLTTSRANTITADHPDSPAAVPAEQPSETNPGTLLRQANRARSLGEIDRAIVLFTELQNQFPSSAQAHVSLVSLGKLLMQRAMPEAALQRFSSYLATTGPLEEEALVGRAQALRALGRTGDEVRTWQRLLLRFPGSLYASAARTRLDALGGVPNQ